MTSIDQHTALLQAELDWLSQVLAARLATHFGEPSAIPDPPDLTGRPGSYADLIDSADLDANARLVLALALAPHLGPERLDPLFVQNPGLNRGFSEFGGWRGTHHNGFLPTGETAAFVVAGADLAGRVAVQRLFRPDGSFRQRDLVRLEGVGAFEPELSGALTISPEWVERLTTGSARKPDYSPDFPAKRLTTGLDWADLVLPPEAMAELAHVRGWMQHERQIMHGWDFQRLLKPGYRCLFYGPPGTGKTLTAVLLGKALGLDVYRVDLSMLVSKYVGETEKNLARIFDQAQNRDWLLFFDEADALFGKRTQANTSMDRYGNQEIAYLLQRVEDYPGLTVLATNLKSNIDDAFARRFQSLVYFPLPDAEHRLALWRGAMGQTVKLGADVRLEEMADRYELAGGNIINIVRYAAIAALNDNRQAISRADLLGGVGKEMRKLGRTI